MRPFSQNSCGLSRNSRSTRRFPKIVLSLAVLWGANQTDRVALGETPYTEQGNKTSLRFSPVVRAIKNVEPSVVNIQGNKTITATTASGGNGGKQEVNGMGTGVIIDPRGYIITNLHVVQDVSRIEVTLADGTKTTARLINYDPDTDLALIRIQIDRDLPVIPIGTSHDLMRGEEVIAIGNPFGYQHTVTKGIVSAMHRDIPVNGTQEYRDLIQTNADINPGNSGGPLVNIDGEVIGINVAVRVGAQGIGFAIPIDAACEVIADLIARANASNVEHGLHLETLHTEEGTETRIASLVTAASSNDGLSLRSGDVVRSVDGHPIRHRMDVELSLIGHRNGEEIDVVVNRDGKSIASRIRLDGEQVALDQKTIQEAWERLGVRLAVVSKQALVEVGEDYSGGLKVLEVRPGSPAAVEGIVSGDIIVGILKWQTSDVAALRYVLGHEFFANAPSANFFVVRNNEVRTASMKVNRTRFR